MTHPTKAICPILLEDFRKISVEKKGDENFFTSDMIKNCMKKVRVVILHENVLVDDALQIRAYYAGHVLGAAMFYVRVGNESAVYTGDYNMTPDRHLGAAWIDRVRPDVLITETTYATTVRDSKRARERDFLKNIHNCVNDGGKVLIPVFALGRAQELCILVETYWERMKLNVPVYFSAGLTERANDYYKLFISWTNQKIKKTFAERNMFDFKHIKPFDRSLADSPGPMVLFAAPGMLHSGTSLEVFKKWAPEPKNMVILPGYCVAGTVGAKILAGIRIFEFEKKNTLHVKMQVKYMSFSAHSDAKGILQLIRQCEPRSVLLVHGEKAKMDILKEKIKQQFNIPCYNPANGQITHIPASSEIPAKLDCDLLSQKLFDCSSFIADEIFQKNRSLNLLQQIKEIYIKSLVQNINIPINGTISSSFDGVARIEQEAFPSRNISVFIGKSAVENVSEFLLKYGQSPLSVLGPIKAISETEMDIGGVSCSFMKTGQLKVSFDFKSLASAVEIINFLQLVQ